MHKSQVAPDLYIRPYERGLRPEQCAADLPNRFIVKVDVDEVTGCWIWTASFTPSGYGRIGKGGRGQGWTGAHRFAWEKVHHSSLLRTTQLDHLCRRPACCNPWHVEPVTAGENARRGLQANSAGLCRRGLHPWVKDNILIDGGYQRCRACRQLWDRQRRPANQLPPAERTHCPQGHPYEGENLKIKPNGFRECRECHRAQSRKTYWRRKQMLPMTKNDL